jgi:hypothetical protein
MSPPHLIHRDGLVAMPLGFVEGQLKIIELKEVDLAGSAGLRPSKRIAENYAEYPLIILGEGGKKEGARLTAGKEGNIALPYHGAITSSICRAAHLVTFGPSHSRSQLFRIRPSGSI